MSDKQREWLYPTAEKRREAYESLSIYFRDIGAPSGKWSLLEKLYKPNSIFLKQREEIQNQEKIIKKLIECLKHWYRPHGEKLLKEIFNDPMIQQYMESEK